MSHSPSLAVLCALAGLIVLVHHLPSYSFDFYDLRHFGLGLDLSYLDLLTRYLGLGLFAFAVGHLCHERCPRIEGRTALGAWAARAVVRVHPLYWVALAAFAAIYVETRPFVLFVHALGLQAFLASAQFQVLWFVGSVVVFLVLYAGIAAWCRTGWQLTGFALAYLAVAALLHGLSLLDGRAILYFAPFLLGVVASRLGLLAKLSLRGLPLFGAAVLAAAWLHARTVSGAPAMSSLRTFLVTDALMLAWIGFAGSAASALRPGAALSACVWVAEAAYCMFLFHRPIWFVMQRGLQQLYPDRVMLHAVVLALVGIPVIALLSSRVQRSYDAHLAPRLERGLSRLLAPRA